VAEAVMAVLAERLGGEGLTVSRVTGVDTFIPLGAAAELCLPSVDGIAAAARELLARPGVTSAGASA
jgi:2-oxoisovalerate dehydrogenase E1 component